LVPDDPLLALNWHGNVEPGRKLVSWQSDPVPDHEKLDFSAYRVCWTFGGGPTAVQYQYM
jgi:hypothetical protein